ncbi:hypothetical protein HMPREF2531_01206 [Bacteroides intestinalis]|uniref:Uncharacterized protein n=1 Tax=Bacteroides intestinalis TaxID=329854 RepID=A0A139LQT1_9BACE|nr:hypothetical protein HMPREF2531_01206 [Bacteroides intestinalis]
MDIAILLLKGGYSEYFDKPSIIRLLGKIPFLRRFSQIVE